MKINNITLAGNLTRDPEVRFLANEKAVANFTIAYSERFKAGNGEQKEETTFVDCECWGRTAEIAGQYLKKGSNAGVIGKLRQQNWTDKESGAKRSKLMIKVDQLILGDRREGGDDRGDADGSRDDAPPAPRPARPAPASAVGGGEDPPF